MEEEGTMISVPFLNPGRDGDPGSSVSSLVRYLYLGHFLARWDARMWEFSVGLYMISVWPDSLLLAALYGVVESASTALFGPFVGKCVDSLTYVQVLRIWLLTQNLSFIVAGGSVIGLLMYPDLKFTNSGIFISLVLLTNISAAVAVLSTLAGVILIEREWVVIISEVDSSPGALTKMNSVIRRIDLTCKLFAPVVSGLIISFVSLKASAITMAVWNTISVWIEYWLLTSVYKGIPALHVSSQRKISRKDEEKTSTCAAEIVESNPREDNGESTSSGLSWKRKLRAVILGSPCVKTWRVYLEQDVILPGVALALLYFTVLSNLRMGRHTYICYWNSTRNKRNSWDSGNTSVSNPRVPHSNTSNWTLVYMVSVDISTSLHSFNMGEEQCSISVHADGQCGYISTWIVDV